MNYWTDRRLAADQFCVGNQGRFDALVRSVLRELGVVYPHIRYGVVLACLPKPGQEAEPDTMLPEGQETVHPRCAIDRRNRWMLRQADVVITWTTHTWGGAAKFAALAQRQGKRSFTWLSRCSCEHLKNPMFFSPPPCILSPGAV